MELQRHDSSSITNLQIHLIQMGFDIEMVNKVLNRFHIINIDQAIEYLIKIDGMWSHPFIIKNIENSQDNETIKQTSLCEICNDIPQNHLINLINIKKEEYSKSINNFTTFKKRKIKSDKNLNSGMKVLYENDNEIDNDDGVGIVRGNIQRIERINSQRNINRDSNNIFAFNLSRNSNDSREDSNNLDIRLKAKLLNPCIVCFEESGDINLLPCKEKICFICLEEYLKNKINTSDVEEIKCPNHKCLEKYIFTDEIIKKIVDQNFLERYEKFLRRAKIIKNPNIILCPIPDCESFAYKINEDVVEFENIEKIEKDKNVNLSVKLIPEAIDKKFFKCQNNHEFCIKCNHFAHPNSNCELKIENEFNLYADNENLRKCPQCNFFIKKLDGCNHMTCGNPLCKYEFCWICLEKFKVNHYRNPINSCYGLQYANENNVLYRNRFLRMFSCVLGSILRLILIILIIIFPTLFVSISWIIYFIVGNRAALKFNNHKMKTFFKIMCSLIYILLSISLFSVGYIGYIIGILTCPITFTFGFIIYIFNTSRLRR